MKVMYFASNRINLLYFFISGNSCPFNKVHDDGFIIFSILLLIWHRPIDYDICIDAFDKVTSA